MANRMLSALEPLLGDWNVAVSDVRFLKDVTGTIGGSAILTRDFDDAIVVMRQTFEDERLPSGVWVLGADDDHGTYSAHYYGSDDVSRLYQMSFANRMLELWRHAPGFTQKFAARLDASGGVLEGEWQSCTDGMNWHRDFRQVLTRR